MSDVIPAMIPVLLIAFLYSSVGHGGATGYIAILTLLAFAPSDISTTALIMNVAVSGLAFYHFTKAGKFRPKLAAPFLIASVPAAFLGGFWKMEDKSFSILLAVVLSSAAIAMMFKVNEQSAGLRTIDRTQGILIGAVLGLISGIIGIGGGIFLSPLLVFMNWATVAEAAAIASCFILLNSLSGLGARIIGHTFYISNTLYLIPVALVGGWIGSNLGANRFRQLILRRLLAAVLLVAAAKAFMEMWK